MEIETLMTPGLEVGEGGCRGGGGWGGWEMWKELSLSFPQ